MRIHVCVHMYTWLPYKGIVHVWHAVGLYMMMVVAAAAAVEFV